MQYKEGRNNAEKPQAFWYVLAKRTFTKKGSKETLNEILFEKYLVPETHLWYTIL